MAANGFYLMHRGWQDHPVFRGEAFSRRDAFAWLIGEAAWSDRRVSTPTGIVIVARGQLTHSVRFMAAAWKWEQTKVRRFLKALCDQQMIVTETATPNATAQTLITICNYTKYQAPDGEPATANAEETPQQRHSSATNENKVNKGNNSSEAKASSHTRTRQPTLERPAEVDEAVWSDFQQHRKGKGAPLTATALAGIGREAGKAGWTLNDALRECCVRGWQGFKAEWVNKGQGNGLNGTTRNGTRPGGRSPDGFGNALARAAEFFGPDNDG